MIFPIQRARHAFVQALAAVYFLAFCSSFWQWPMLHSPTHGLVPVLLLSEQAQFALHLLGMSLALSIALRIFTSNVFFLLPALYWGLVSLSRRSGAPFFNYQWDNLLIEAGVVGSLWGVQSVDQPARSVLWALRFLIFKLMFMSGVVKILSNDRVWLDMSALKYHLGSQPLPTPLAWFAAKYCPDWALKMGIAATLWIEIPIAALLIFPPLASWPRQTAGMLTIGLMLSIALAGNYNFFNLLTMVLTIPSLVGEEQKGGGRWRQVIVSSLAAAALAYYTCTFMFDFQRDGELLVLRMSPETLSKELEWGIPLACALALACCLGGLVMDLFRAWREDIASFHVTLGLGVLALGFIAMSATPMILSLHPDPVLLLPAKVLHLYQHFGKEICFSYGLFRSMTGVGARGQVAVPMLRIVETLAAPHGRGGEDQLVEFSYYAQCTFVAPHQPRLDWQLWFAALGPEYALRQPWFRALVDKLFEREPLLLAQLRTAATPPVSIESIHVDLVHAKFDFEKSFSATARGGWWKPVSTPRELARIRRPEAKKRLKKSQLLHLWGEHAVEITTSLVIAFCSLKLTMVARNW